MKILWIVNILFPHPSQKLGKSNNVFGGWLKSLAQSITKKNNVKLAIATVSNSIKHCMKFEDEIAIYYVLPCKNIYKYDKKIEKYWEEIIKDFNPTLVHIHGTEFPHSLAFLNVNQNHIKSVVSIQGLVSACANVYEANMNYKDIYCNITFRDIIRFDNIYQQKKKFLNRGKYEIDILNKCNYIIGRTEWDYANTYAIVKKDKYFKCNETLRDSFYDQSWNLKEIERKTIYISQASYPLKGFHIFLKALSLLKDDYPDVKVYVSGPNVLDRNNLMNKIKFSGYAKYLHKIIKKENLEKNVVFVGLTDEKELVKLMLKCNVFVQSSSLENSSNSLGEAMMLNMPIVASYVGGTPSMILDKKEALLYPYTDYAMLYFYIKKVFEDDELAVKLGLNAKKHAMVTHDKVTNATRMLEIYKEISNENNK